MSNLYQPRFNGFDLTPVNRIFAARVTPQVAFKSAFAEVEGSPGVYLGKTFTGATTITVSGKIIGANGGTDYADFEARFDALLAALDTEEPALLYRKADEYWLAQCVAAPAKDLDAEKNVAWCDFVIVFRGKRVS
jgi:ethanolamine utilization microcompartment shell protein EutL